MSREGHLQQLYHIFAYLNNKHNSELVFDPSIPNVEGSLFGKQDWSQTVYATGIDGDLTEELSPNLPEERGHGFLMRVFVDSDHAGCAITRQSRTGFLISS